MNFSLRTTWLCAAEAWRRRRHIAAQFSNQNHISSRIFIDLAPTRSAAAVELRESEKMNWAYPGAAACRVLTCVKSHHAWGGLFPSAESDPPIASFFLLTRIEGHFSISHSASKLEATASGWNLFLRRAHIYWADAVRRLPRYFSLSRRRYDSAQKPFLSCAPLACSLEYYI